MVLLKKKETWFILTRVDNGGDMKRYLKTVLMTVLAMTGKESHYLGKR